MRLKSYKKVTSIEEAYELQINKDNVVIGGGAWLKLGDSIKDIAIDLENLNLNTIEVLNNEIHIGAMTTLYQLETCEELQKLYNGIISISASKIMGVQVRNIATIGGTICGRYGFSDLITPLLVSKAKLVFFKKGLVSLEDYLEEKHREKDILLEVIIPIKEGYGKVEIFKKTSIDFSLLNVAVVKEKESQELLLAIGARPGLAKLKAISKEALLGKVNIIEDVDLHALHEKVNAVVDEFSFGTNQRASKEYRIELAKALLQKCIKEVLS